MAFFHEIRKHGFNVEYALQPRNLDTTQRILRDGHSLATKPSYIKLECSLFSIVSELLPTIYCFIDSYGVKVPEAIG